MRSQGLKNLARLAQRAGDLRESVARQRSEQLQQGISTFIVSKQGMQLVPRVA